MSFLNATPWSAAPLPYVDAMGREIVLVIVKASYEKSPEGRMLPAQKPSPIRFADLPWDEHAPGGSIKYPSDVGGARAGTDVIVVGSAVAHAPVELMDVIVRVGALEAPLVVHGERRYVRGAGGLVVGPSARFEIMPIIYEKAYGGLSADARGGDERNPLGVGFAQREADLEGTPAPQIEHPARRHRRASDTFPAMGYGAIPMHWLPRRAFAGTFDDHWRRERMPLQPTDYDPRFERLAHPSLQMPAFLEKNTAISAVGLSREGLFRCEVSAPAIVVHGRYETGRVSVRPPVDTLLIEPEARRVELTARAIFPMGRGKTSLREIRVDSHDD